MTWATRPTKKPDPTPTSKKRSIQGAGDCRAVVEIAESTHYKKRTMDTKKGHVENPREIYTYTPALF